MARAVVAVVRGFAARLAEEGDGEEARHVERGEECGREADAEERLIMGECREEDRILREETGQAGTTCESKRAEGERRSRDAHRLREAAHFPDVLLVVQRVDDRACAEEEQRLEECVRPQMEHRRAAFDVRREARSHDHVAELRERGVGEDALDVVLLRGHERGEDARDAADPRDDHPGDRRKIDEERETREHVHARGDHRRGVDERGDGRGAFHRVRQPCVERELRALSNRTAEDEEHCRTEEIRILREHGLLVLEAVERDGARSRPQHEDAEHETEVAEAVHDERLVRGLARGVAGEPVADEQVAAHADEFPEDEHHREIVREHDAEHREHEEREVAEEARLRLVVLHVHRAVKVHEEADAGDDEEHRLREMIELYPERDLQGLAEINPLHRAVDFRQRPRAKRGDETEQCRQRADGRADAVIFPRGDEDQHRCDERIQEDEPGK